MNSKYVCVCEKDTHTQNGGGWRKGGREKFQLTS